MTTSPTSQQWTKLHDLRVNKGHTLTTLAREADITVGYMSLIESGQRNPREPVVKRLADALGVTPLELMAAD